MATSFGALCTDFYINQKIAVKLDLPNNRETVVHLFDRIRSSHPKMERLRQYPDELALESPRRDGQYQWISLQGKSIRSGSVNPDSMKQAYRFQREMLEICPYFLTISPLEIDSIDLMFGFDFECKANHNLIIQEALLADSPMGRLLDEPNTKTLDVQPYFGIALNDKCDLQAWFEVKTRTSQGEIRRDRFRSEPLSVFVTVRKLGPVRKLDELLVIFDQLSQTIEQLATEKAIPTLIQPINRAIIGTV